MRINYFYLPNVKDRIDVRQSRMSCSPVRFKFESLFSHPWDLPSATDKLTIISWSPEQRWDQAERSFRGHMRNIVSRRMRQWSFHFNISSASLKSQASNAHKFQIWHSEEVSDNHHKIDWDRQNPPWFFRNQHLSQVLFHHVRFRLCRRLGPKRPRSISALRSSKWKMPFDVLDNCPWLVSQTNSRQQSRICPIVFQPTHAFCLLAGQRWSRSSCLLWFGKRNQDFQILDTCPEFASKTNSRLQSRICPLVFQPTDTSCFLTGQCSHPKPEKVPKSIQRGHSWHKWMWQRHAKESLCKSWPWFFSYLWDELQACHWHHESSQNSLEFSKYAKKD